MSQLIVTAVAEKIAVLTTVDDFATRKARADLAAFDLLMRRDAGEPLRPDDVVPDDLQDAVAELRDTPTRAR